MMQILLTAQCITRHSIISPDRLSEILTAIVTNGEIVGGNSRDHDVVSPKFGRVEVKARILGIDGQFPRVSLKSSNIERADYFMAVRWTATMQLHDAVGLPKAEISTLYSAKQKSSGLAHIAWNGLDKGSHRSAFRRGDASSGWAIIILQRPRPTPNANGRQPIAPALPRAAPETRLCSGRPHRGSACGNDSRTAVSSDLARHLAGCVSAA